jgi:hypothetical protein
LQSSQEQHRYRFTAVTYDDPDRLTSICAVLPDFVHGVVCMVFEQSTIFRLPNCPVGEVACAATTCKLSRKKWRNDDSSQSNLSE